MLKSFITFAVLGGSAAVACAQGGIATEGVTDAGESGCVRACGTETGGSARQSSSGTPDRETAITPVVFTEETEMPLDSGHLGRLGYHVGHHPWLGLAGEFDAFSIDRRYTPYRRALIDVADPFKGDMARQGIDLLGAGRRGDNNVQYYGPLARGLSAGASYSVKEKVDTSPAGRAWGMTLGFESGPLTVRAAHQNQNAVRVQFSNKVSNDIVARNSILAANLRLGWGTAYAAYSLSRGWAGSPLFNPDNPYAAGIARTPTSNSRDVLVGMAVPVGKRTTFLTSYIQKDDRDLANQDANQLAIGASHALSRRADFYVAVSHIRNRNGAGYRVGDAGSRSSNSAFNVGMRRAF